MEYRVDVRGPWPMLINGMNVVELVGMSRADAQRLCNGLNAPTYTV